MFALSRAYRAHPSILTGGTYGGGGEGEVIARHLLPALILTHDGHLGSLYKFWMKPDFRVA